MEAIWVALITGACSVVAVIISNNKSNKEMQHQMEIHQAVTDEKITELTREVREHNNFAHRMPVVENDIKTIKQSINELKEYHK